MQIHRERDDHGQVFTKPSVETMRYPAYRADACKTDFVVEFFKFSELKKRGFTSPYLTNNPYTHDFNSFVDGYLSRNSHLPESEMYRRLHADLEIKNQLALQEVGLKYGTKNLSCL